MAFRFKDLMISTVREGPGAEACGTVTRGWGGCLPTLICEGTAVCKATGAGCVPTLLCRGTGNCAGTPMMIFCCFIFTGVCTGSPHVQPCGDLADQLAELKAQLGQAVADIENLEKDLKERAQPQTVAEVEELERKLEAAMAELKKQKSELEKE